ncbi:glycosyltransferase family 4 protein [Candidatus Roizmanbacteria bacterium]|nr:glycosyltransferase family 4 protein [Candidatus Roizmanbacteria bacterium]
MSVFVFDPTVSDQQSKVRGVGRYLQILQENLPEVQFVNVLNSVPYESVLINPFLNLIAPPLISKRLAKKQIGVIHDLIPLKYPSHFPLGLRGNYKYLLNRHYLRYYDLFVTDSETSRNDLIKILKIPGGKIKVVYPTLGRRFFQQKMKADFQPPVNKYCLYVGDATWNKNLICLARAIKKINVTAVFVGKVFADIATVRDLARHSPPHPWEREFQGFLDETQGDKRFIFIGYVSDSMLIKFYQQAHCNVLISRDEGFGFSYLESATLGTPSVLSDIPVFHEVAKDQAMFADPKNVADIANKIGELYFNDEVWKLWKAKALYRAKYFSQEKFRANWQSILAV